MDRIKRKITVQSLIILQLYNCYYFYNHTKGLLYIDNRGYIVYTYNLQSSGDEDNIFVFLIIIIYVLLLLISFFVKNKYLFYLCIPTTLIFLFSLGFIQSGEIVNTIIYDKNISLALTIILPFVLLYLCYLIKFKE